MNMAINRMLSRYAIENTEDAKNALREIIQVVALYGLWRGGFFKKAAFYGGTALRVLYGLNRFSEDMDFSLLEKDISFTFSPYKEVLESTLNDFGFSLEFSSRDKLSGNSIRSAFLKGNTLNHFMEIGIPEEFRGLSGPRSKLKIKIEVDVDPPGRFSTEMKSVLEPIPFVLKVYEEPSLFAGKMHAVLFRHWRDRVKGRDWYDMVWYLQRAIPLDLPCLEEKMRQGGQWNDLRPFTDEDFLILYRKKAAEVDIKKAINDVTPFLRDPEYVESVWSNTFFLDIAEKFRFKN